MRVHKLVTRPTSWGFSESKRDGIEYVALALQTRYARDLAHAPGGAPAIQENDDVDGLGNQRARRLIAERSEEHTSELQSLMRISYAVFCLKKKTLEQMNNDIRQTRTNSIEHR